ncbi:hypothetical protein HDU85_005728 [Gaertneriomyces sp. JEL0708]|nr:hypothetical protein HDU85_005728 [Gaertneriomyces sp. JEL0708]
MAFPYEFIWNATRPASELNTFLNSSRPSETYTDSTDWIWVRDDAKETLHKASGKYDGNGGTFAEAKELGMDVLETLKRRIQKIKDDPSIPARATKANPNSKPRIREAAQRDAKALITSIARSHGQTCGKWMFFPTLKQCDSMFRTIAMSLLFGPLKKTQAFCCKISPRKRDVPDDAQDYVICLYVPDIFDKEMTEEVLSVLIEDHGIVPGPAKPDLYTYIGLYQGHPSGLKATCWTVKDFMEKEEVEKRLARGMNVILID